MRNLTPSRRRTAVEFLTLILAAAVMAFNYALFILPNAFAPAGLNGLATMVQYLFHFSVGYFSLIVNIPLALLCALFVNRSFALRTLLFALVFAGTLLFLQTYPVLSRFVYHTQDGRSTLLAPVIAGAVNGFIYGTVFHAGGSTGGTDFVAAFVHKKNPAYSLSHVIFALNAAVAMLSYFVYDYQIEPVALCIVYCLITTMVSDRILAGGKQAIRVDMITAHPDEITRAVVEELHHSTTILRATGGFSHQDKTLLICVVNKHQMPQMEQILRRYPDTFATATLVSETMGNFKRIR